MRGRNRVLEATVYAWPDGWRITTTTPRKDHSVLFFLYSSAGAVAVRFYVYGTDAGDHVLTASHDRHLPWPEEVERRVLGFALDLGATRPDDERKALVSNVYSDHVEVELAAYPRFVDDVLWEGRYEEISQLALEGRSCPFLGVVDALFVQESEPSRDLAKERRVLAVWGKRGVVGSIEAPTLAEAADKVTSDALVLPESRRASWEAEHVLRGAWVLPSPDEVGLFRALGEDLPFWWGGERFGAWLSERSA